MAAGIECFRVLFPKGMDANEYALKVTPAAKSLGLLLNKAEWMGKGKRSPKRLKKKPVEVVMEETVFPLAAEALPVIEVPAEVRGEEIVDHARGSALSRTRASKESQLRSAENQSAGFAELRAFTSIRSISIRRGSARCS